MSLMKRIISLFTFIDLSLFGLLDLGIRLSSLPPDSFKHLLHLNIVGSSYTICILVLSTPYFFEISLNLASSLFENLEALISLSIVSLYRGNNLLSCIFTTLFSLIWRVSYVS